MRRCLIESARYPQSTQPMNIPNATPYSIIRQSPASLPDTTDLSLCIYSPSMVIEELENLLQERSPTSLACAWTCTWASSTMRKRSALRRTKTACSQGFYAPLNYQQVQAIVTPIREQAAKHLFRGAATPQSPPFSDRIADAWRS